MTGWGVECKIDWCEMGLPIVDCEIVQGDGEDLPCKLVKRRAFCVGFVEREQKQSNSYSISLKP